MFQHQTKWLLSALLVAPLLTSAPARADYDQNYDADQVRSSLKDVMKWSSDDGDNYTFKKDGSFVLRRTGKSAARSAYDVEYGRFIVEPMLDTAKIPGGPQNLLALNTSASKRTAKSKTVARESSLFRSIQVMSKYKDGSGGKRFRRRWQNAVLYQNRRQAVLRRALKYHADAAINPKLIAVQTTTNSQIYVAIDRHTDSGVRAAPAVTQIAVNQRLMV